MSTDSPAPSSAWLDEIPVKHPPFQVGQLLEAPSRDVPGAMSYYRVNAVDENGKIADATLLGRIEEAASPQVLAALK